MPKDRTHPSSLRKPTDQVARQDSRHRSPEKGRNAECTDHFIQYWYAVISNASKLEYYSQFKSEIKLEKYVECISNENLRSELAALRLSAHNLKIERG